VLAVTESIPLKPDRWSHPQGEEGSNVPRYPRVCGMARGGRSFKCFAKMFMLGRGFPATRRVYRGYTQSLLGPASVSRRRPNKGLWQSDTNSLALEYDTIGAPDK
jgi:hypothetical protein